MNDYYFQIDYTIQQAICQPVSIFHGKNAINTIRALVDQFSIIKTIFIFFLKQTVQELIGVLSPNAQIYLNILHMDGILKSSERLIKSTSEFKQIFSKIFN